jgi:hypothetical protein
MTSAVVDTRELGNEAMRLGRWAEEALYSRAIHERRGDCKSRCNRAQAYLKLGQPLLAWGDTLHVQEFCKDDAKLVAKAAFRFAVSFQDLGLFDEADAAFKACQERPHLAPWFNAAERKDLTDRRAQCGPGRAEQITRAESMTVGPGASAHANSGFTPAKSAAFLRTNAMSGHAVLPRSCRCGPGQPRHPDAVMRAFADKFGPLAVLRVHPRGDGSVGVFAAKKLRAGTVVHVEEPLLAAVLDATRCYHCLRPLGPGRGVPCSGAPTTMGVRAACDRRYCRAACEAAAFSTYHGLLCSAAGGAAVTRIESRSAAGSTASSRFILIAWKLLGLALRDAVERQATAVKKGGEDSSSSGSGGGCAAPSLVPPADLAPFCYLPRANDRGTEAEAAAPDPEQMQCVALYPLRTWTLLRELAGSLLACDPALSMRWVCDMFSLLGPNAISVRVPGSASILDNGVALMAAGNCFNHSCVPNLEEVSDADVTGSRLSFITSTAVAQGEELCISYCDTDAPYAARRECLKGQYGFLCACPKCSFESAAAAAAQTGAGRKKAGKRK